MPQSVSGLARMTARTYDAVAAYWRQQPSGAAKSKINKAAMHLFSAWDLLEAVGQKKRTSRRR